MRLSFILVFWFWALSLMGQEAILDYDVEIGILSDSKIEVTETIKVRAAGQQIQRGIFRTIPTVRPDKTGRDEPAPVEILDVQRDGEEEEYHVEKSRENLTIYIGEESVILDPGVYTFQLRYLAENQIGYFGEYDELYWNVIGHNWAFTINEFSVDIHLPQGAGYIQGDCYTGYAGSKASNCTLEVDSTTGVVHGIGQGILQPGEGFTVAVAWPKGYVSNIQSRSYDLGWLNGLIYIIGLFLFLFYGYGLWKKQGVDPPRQAIVPDWHPLADYSPAEHSYLFHRSITEEAATAALVSAAVAGVIRIENKKKEFTFHRLSGSEALKPEEKVLVDGILPSGQDTFKLKSSTYTKYQSAKSEFQKSQMSRLNIEEYFRPNWKAGLKAMLLMALVTTATLSVGMYPLMNRFIYSVLVTFLLVWLTSVIMAWLFRIMKWYKWLIIITLWTLMTAGFTLIYSQALFHTDSFIRVGIIIAVTMLLAGLFNYLIYAPTIKGQKSIAEIMGFRMYLDKSEKEMLNYFTPPEQTPELFEKLLPYAIALGVENRWGKKFKQILDAAIENGSYSPIWYSGNIHQINSLHSNFQSSVSHAAPKSSSGSGGGGSSGGGGGGGGGGGW